ncbi:MAG: hypothetical protein ACR2KJ_00615 [Jatrophihabitans sp.]
MTSTTDKDATIGAIEAARREVDPYFYNVTLLFPKSEIADAMPWALRDGRVSSADLPAAPDRSTLTYETRMAFIRGVHAVLESSGALEEFRRYRMMDAQPARCPFWCAGDHASIFSNDGVLDFLVHELVLARVNFSVKDGLHGDGMLELVVNAVQNKDGTVDATAVGIAGDLPESLDAADVAALAEAFAHARDSFNAIIGVSTIVDTETEGVTR